MQTRSLVVAIALVLALAVAAPTIGATTNQRGVVAENALDVAKQAREIAKSAKRTSNRARGAAQSALDIANGANAAATSAATKADDASAAAGDASGKADAASSAASSASAKADAVAADLAASKAKSSTASGLVSSTNQTDYENLGGPSVTVTVPASGLIQVWARADVEDGSVSLFEDGAQVPDLDPNGVCAGPSGALLAFDFGGDATISTPAGEALGLCGSVGPPAPVLISTAAGEHTYSLRYAWCGCGSQGNFSDRFLAVAPLP